MIHKAQLLAMFASGPFAEALLKMKIKFQSQQNVRDIVRTLRKNLTSKYAGPYTSIVTVPYLKFWENIHPFTDVFIAENIIFIE